MIRQHCRHPIKSNYTSQHLIISFDTDIPSKLIPSTIISKITPYITYSIITPNSNLDDFHQSATNDFHNNNITSAGASTNKHL